MDFPTVFRADFFFLLSKVIKIGTKTSMDCPSLTPKHPYLTTMVSYYLITLASSCGAGAEDGASMWPKLLGEFGAIEIESSSWIGLCVLRRVASAPRTPRRTAAPQRSWRRSRHYSRSYRPVWSTSGLRRRACNAETHQRAPPTIDIVHYLLRDTSSNTV